MKKIDALGLSCPKPIIMVKRAMKEMSIGEEFEVVCDNTISYKNLIRYLEDLESNPQGEEKEDYYLIRATNSGVGQAKDVSNYCSI
jgi:TusA-related sulfurtransferase